MQFSLPCKDNLSENLAVFKINDSPCHLTAKLDQMDNFSAQILSHRVQKQEDFGSAICLSSFVIVHFILLSSPFNRNDPQCFIWAKQALKIVEDCPLLLLLWVLQKCHLSCLQKQKKWDNFIALWNYRFALLC